LYVLDGNPTGQKYRDNVLAPHVVFHFDNHALAERPMFMDNARPHRARIVQHFLQQEAVQTIPWPAMSPDMNPIEHVRYGTYWPKNLPMQSKMSKYWRIKNCYLTGVATIPPRTAYASCAKNDEACYRTSQ
jgi:hypothetical protein